MPRQKCQAARSAGLAGSGGFILGDLQAKAKRYSLRVVTPVGLAGSAIPARPALLFRLLLRSPVMGMMGIDIPFAGLCQWSHGIMVMAACTSNEQTAYYLLLDIAFICTLILYIPQKAYQLSATSRTRTNCGTHTGHNRNSVIRYRSRSRVAE